MTRNSKNEYSKNEYSKNGYEKSEYSKNWETLFAKYHSLTAKEFSELSGTPRTESENVLNSLVTKGHLEKLTTKNGSVWTIKNISR